MNLAPEAEKSLKTVGDVELPKLGVVPQTVFLKARSSDSMLRTPRKASHELLGRGAATGLPRVQRLQSSDSNGSGAPFEDLRRRLATINGSTSSLHLPQPVRDVRAVSSPVAGTFNTPPSTLIEARPGSPTESIVSAANSSTFRPLSRLQMSGVDTQKAAPAIGSSKTNVTGFLDSHTKLRSEGSSEQSGRSSPTSMSNTIRATHRHPTSLPISSYGT